MVELCVLSCLFTTVVKHFVPLLGVPLVRQLKGGKSSLHRTEKIREKVERPGEALKERKRPIGGGSNAQATVAPILEAAPLGKLARPVQPQLITR